MFHALGEHLVLNSQLTVKLIKFGTELLNLFNLLAVSLYLQKNLLDLVSQIDRFQLLRLRRVTRDRIISKSGLLLFQRLS